MNYTLRKNEILRGRKNFQKVFAGGKLNSNLLTCFYVIEKQKDYRANPIRVGFTLSRKIRGAVVRNRLKRLMRESYRLNKNILDLKAVENFQISILFIFKKHPLDKKIKLEEVRNEVVQFLINIKNIISQEVNQ